jgi:two-component system response regulator ResD
MLMSQAVVLILADDIDSATIRAGILRHRSIETRIIRYGPQSKGVKLTGQYNLVLIDSNYNSEDALALCRQVRAECAKPLLLLTYESDVRYHIDAYAAGADDCITNTVSVLLFLAKIAAWLRRDAVMRAEAATVLREENPLRTVDNGKVSKNGLTVDPKSRRVSTPEGHAVKLSVLEFRLFRIFLANQGRVLETSHLLSKVWDNYEDVDTRLLTNLVYRLRQKLAAEPIKLNHIRTVDRIGYVYE